MFYSPNVLLLEAGETKCFNIAVWLLEAYLFLWIWWRWKQGYPGFFPFMTIKFPIPDWESRDTPIKLFTVQTVLISNTDPMKLSTVFIPGFFLLRSIPVFARLAQAHLYSLLFEPVGVPLVLAVHFHLLGPQRQAAVAVEVQAIVSTDVRPLRLPIAILRLQKLRQARLCPLGSERTGRGWSGVPVALGSM